MVSIMEENLLHPSTEVSPTNICVNAVTGDALKIEGVTNIELQVGDKRIGEHKFLVASEKFPDFQGIIGNDWLTKKEAVLDYANECVWVKNLKIPILRRIARKSMGLVSTLTEDDGMFHGKNDKKFEEKEEFLEEEEKLEIIAVSELDIFSPATGVLKATFPRKKVKERDKAFMLVEPTEIATKGLEDLTIGRALVDLKNDYVYVPYINCSGKTVTIKKGDIVALGTVLRKPENAGRSNKSKKGGHNPSNYSSNMVKGLGSLGENNSKDLLINSDSSEEESKHSNGCKLCNYSSLKDRIMRRRSCRKRKYDANARLSENTVYVFNIGAIEHTEDLDHPDEIDDLIRQAVRRSECPEAQQAQLENLLLSNKKALAKKGDAVGLCEMYEPSIQLDTEEPIYTPQYPIPFKMRDEMKKAVDGFLKEGIIQYSKSPYNSPTIMVTKKDGGFRMCIDFRKLNEHVITDPHPLPRISQILEGLGGCMYYTALDLLHGFYNLKIKAKDREKTAFSTYEGHYEFVRLPMGLKSSPSIFQRLMNLVLSGCLGKYAYIYIDDIVIYSKNATEHLDHLSKVLTQLNESGLKLKFSKCQLFMTKIDYLGFVISKEGLMVNPNKMKAVEDFPIPKDVKGIQAFVGLVGYFRVFIKDFAKRARPLYDLLKKGTKFLWGINQNEAFESLKSALLSAPVLAFPDFSKEFILTTDASHYAIGALLTQNYPEGERLISCSSRSLTEAELNYSNTDREILAVIDGVLHNRSYLWGNKFTIKTDHSAIPYLVRNKGDNARSIRWFMLLSEYDYTIEHKAGKKIQHADALSRYPWDEKLNDGNKDQKILAYISPGFQSTEYAPVWDEDEWREITKEDKAKPLIDGVIYTEEKGLVYKNTAEHKLLWVPGKLRNYVMHAYHDPPAMGHKGVDKMYGAMKFDVHWTNAERDVRDFIKNCDICQRYKNYKHQTPVQNMPIPLNCFEEVSMDVVGPVPYSKSGQRYILAIQDRLSRWLIFVAMVDQSAPTTARLFLTHWVCMYGVPLKLINDRGTNFVSQVFKELRDFIGTNPGKTTAYRPQGNGMNERTHQELHQYIAMYLTPSTRSTWDTMLNLAAWVHNSTVHDVLKCSPFEIVTGLKPRSAKAWLPQPGENIGKLTEQFQEYYGVDRDYLSFIRERAREMIKKSQDSYLQRLNIHSRNIEYKKGDKVLVRNHDKTSYVSRKWSHKYNGPYTVIDVISPTVLKVKDDKYGKEDLVHLVYVRPYNQSTMSPPVSKRELRQVLREEDNDRFGKKLKSNLKKTDEKPLIEIDEDDDDGYVEILPQSTTVFRNSDATDSDKEDSSIDVSFSSPRASTPNLEYPGWNISRGIGNKIQKVWSRISRSQDPTFYDATVGNSSNDSPPTNEDHSKNSTPPHRQRTRSDPSRSLTSSDSSQNSSPTAEPPTTVPRREGLRDRAVTSTPKYTFNRQYNRRK
jgi:hypothetical protein